MKLKEELQTMQKELDRLKRETNEVSLRTK